MSQVKHVYRNKRNGRVGEMTDEQAAIWPELLELVEDEAPAPEPEPTPTIVIDKKTFGAPPTGDPIPANTDKKD